MGKLAQRGYDLSLWGNLNEQMEIYYNIQETIPMLEEELSDIAKETGDSKGGSEFLSYQVLGMNKWNYVLFPKVLLGSPNENFLVWGLYRKAKLNWDFFLPHFQSLVELWFSKHCLWWLSACSYLIGFCLLSQLLGNQVLPLGHYAYNSSISQQVDG